MTELEFHEVLGKETLLLPHFTEEETEGQGGSLTTQGETRKQHMKDQAFLSGLAIHPDFCLRLQEGSGGPGEPHRLHPAAFHLRFHKPQKGTPS